MAKVYVDFVEFPKDENGEIYVYRYEPVEYFKATSKNYPKTTIHKQTNIYYI